jgi:glycogen operon protein
MSVSMQGQRLASGSPWPLGAEVVSQGVNFAVWAPDATRLELCLFDADGVQELARHDLPVCTDGVWHGLLIGAAAGRAAGAWAVGSGAGAPVQPGQGAA